MFKQPTSTFPALVWDETAWKLLRLQGRISRKMSLSPGEKFKWSDAPAQPLKADSSRHQPPESCSNNPLQHFLPWFGPKRPGSCCGWKVPPLQGRVRLPSAIRAKLPATNKNASQLPKIAHNQACLANIVPNAPHNCTSLPIIWLFRHHVELQTLPALARNARGLKFLLIQIGAPKCCLRLLRKWNKTGCSAGPFCH